MSFNDVGDRVKPSEGHDYVKKGTKSNRFIVNVGSRDLIMTSNHQNDNIDNVDDPENTQNSEKPGECIEIEILPKLTKSITTLNYLEILNLHDLSGPVSPTSISLGRNLINYAAGKTTTLNYLDFYNSSPNLEISHRSTTATANLVKLSMLSTNLIEPRLSTKFYRKGNFLKASQDKIIHSLSTTTKLPLEILQTYIKPHETNVYLRVDKVKGQEKVYNYTFDKNTKFEIDNNCLYQSRKEFMEFTTRFEKKYISEFSEHLAKVLTLNAGDECSHPQSDKISLILVKGPSKSGKTFEISIAASLSGYFIHTIDGNSLSLDSETNIKASFEVGIDTAKRFGTAILVKNLDLLCSSDKGI